MSKPVSPNSQAEIRKRILEGNQRRNEEARKQREYTREIQEEEEEAKTMQRGDISKFVSNILISLLFISLPMTEPEVDWIQVAVFAITNLVWNILFHRHTWMHYATFIMINILLVQWTHEMYNIPKWIAAIPPMQLGAFVGANIAVALGCYFLYVDKVTKKREREERWDITFALMIVLNLVAMVAFGVIPLSLIYHAFKSLVGLVS